MCLVLERSHLRLRKPIGFHLRLANLAHVLLEPLAVPSELLLGDKCVPVKHLEHVRLEQIHLGELDAAHLPDLLIREVHIVAELGHQENRGEDDSTIVVRLNHSLTDVQ